MHSSHLFAAKKFLSQVSNCAEYGYKYLRAVYTRVGHVYAPFTLSQLYFHHKLVARFTHPEAVTNR